MREILPGTQISTFKLRRRTPGTYVLVPYPKQGRSIRCQGQLEAATAQILAACPLDSVGCLITDLRMPGTDGSELQRRLLAANSTLAVVVVTGHADVATAVRLMENGAVTLLEKPYDDSSLLRAVRQAIARSHREHASRRRQSEVAHRLSALTDEERRVLDCLLENKANKTIAFELGISLRTVDRRRRAVLDKMCAASVPELAAMVAAHEPSQDSAARVLAMN